MSTDIATSQGFQERMMAKIRESIGELMTPEELKKIVAAGTEKAFFHAEVHRDQWGRETRTDSLIITQLRTMLEERVKVQVGEWFKENQEKVQGIVAQELDKGIVRLLAEAMTNHFSAPFYQFQNALRDKGMTL